MTRHPDSRTLPGTFDMLADAHARPRPRAPRLPFLIVGLIVVLIAGLFVALVIEERKVQRESMSRDVDAAARQLGLRLDALGQALASLAFQLSDGPKQVARFRIQAAELLSTRPEVVRVQFVGPDHSIVAQAAALSGLGAPSALEPDIEAALDPTRLGSSLVFVQAKEGPGELVAIAPMVSLGRNRGALIARVDGTELLMRVVAPEIIRQYRLALAFDDRVLGRTSAHFQPDGQSTYATTLSPLPPTASLAAAAYETETTLVEGALYWVVGGLALAVVVALASLALFMSRQARIDRALFAEAALRRAMEDSLATGFRVLDLEGRILYVNRSFCRMSGWSAGELVGRRPPFPDWPPGDAETSRRAFEAMLAGKEPPAGTEVVVRRPDGSRFDARMYSSPLVDVHGEQIGWMTSIADVTEQRRIRTELIAAHERVKTVLESIDAAVSVAAAGSAELLFANRSYLERFGADVGGHARLAAMLLERDGGEIFDAATGRWFDVRARAIQWPVGPPEAQTTAPTNDRARLQIASDITLRKTAEELARQQQEKVQFTSRLMTMGEMASSLAHELNQPLTAISNYSEGTLARMRGGTLPPDDLRNALTKMAQQAQRAGSIIRRIREFVKRSEPRRRPTAATRIVEDAIAFAEIEANKKAITIVATVDPALPPLDVDPILIEQVLLNLLKNALDSMSQATVRRIDVRVHAAADGVAEVCVIDRGTGIAPEHLPNVFLPFFSTKTEGMGIGLNICRSIVEFHHGRMFVGANDEPAGGVVVRFTLPLARAAAEAPAALTRT
jgi:PAS domain S-box-containing protein